MADGATGGGLNQEDIDAAIEANENLLNRDDDYEEEGEEGEEEGKDEGKANGDETRGTDGDDGDEAGDEEGPAFETVEQLAEELEVEPDQLLGLKVKFKAAGEEHESTLSDLVKGYQLESDYTRSKQQLSERERSLTEEHRENTEKLNQFVAILGAEFQSTEKAIQEQLDSPEMLQLKVTDQAQYSVRALELQNAQRALHDQRREFAEQYQKHVEDQHGKFLDAERKRMEREIPDFSQAVLDEAVGVVKELGYSENEIKFLTDHRLVKAALELKSLREENQALREAKEKGKRVSDKIRKKTPSKRSFKTRGGGRGGNLSAAKSRFKKSGSLEDAANVFLEYESARQRRGT